MTSTEISIGDNPSVALDLEFRDESKSRCSYYCYSNDDGSLA